jgi:choline-glycine betaine transporter
LIAIIGGVACSLGTGTMQVTSGLNNIFGVPINKGTWFIVAMTIVISFTISSYTGVKKGIKFLSDQNVKLFAIVLGFVFIVGPTTYILDIGTESIAGMFSSMFTRLNFTGGVTGDTWPVFWTMWMFVGTAGFAPLIGMFMARISYGRTVRDMLLAYWISPSIFIGAWFSAFGGTAIFYQKTGVSDLWGKLQEVGLEASIFEFFGALPGGGILVYVFLLTIFISFVTLADSMTSVIAIMSTDTAMDIRGKGEAPAVIKIIWAALMGITSYVFIAYAGIEGAKSILLITGFPIIVLCGFAIVSLYNVMFKYKCKVPENIETVENIKAIN